MVQLKDFTLKELKAIAKKYNDYAKIAGYSKLKKEELIKKIKGHPNLKVEETDKGVKLSILNYELGPVDKIVKEKKQRKKVEPGKKAETHTMPDGSKMTGKVHSEDSKPVKNKLKKVKPKKERSEKQKANDKRLGEMAKKK